MKKRTIKNNCAPLFASTAEVIYLWSDTAKTEEEKDSFKADVTALVMYLIDYGIFGQTPELDGVPERVAVACLMMKPYIDNFQRDRENGRKGGRPPKKSVPPSEYIEQQINGTLPEGKKATAEQIEAVKRLQEKL